MAGALLYLTLRSAQNAIVAWFQRLRQPRYSAGLAAGAFYFYWFLARPHAKSPGPLSGGLAAALAGTYHDAALVVGASLLLALAALVWVGPSSDRDPLRFKPADVQFLFPAPVTRRTLVHYKVLRACVRPLLSGAFLTLAFRPGDLASGLLLFVGIVAVLETMNFYLIGVSLRRQPARATTPQWIARAILGAAVAVVVATVAFDWPVLSGASSAAAIATELARLGTTGAAGAMLLPFVLLARLPLAPTPAAFLQALPKTLILLVIAYRWAVGADASLERVSTQMPAEATPSVRGARLQPSTQLRVPFVLSPVGPAETALLWKNIISTSRYISFKLLLPLLAALLASALIRANGSRGGGLVGAIAFLCVVIVGYTTLLGPQMARNDLRQDLAHLAVLKAWPLRGAVIVRGEVLAPTVLLSVIVWLAASAAFALSSNLRFATALPLAERVSYAVAVMLIAPGLILTQVVLQNAMAVMFPAWVSAVRTRGVDVVGQRLLMMGAVVLVLAIACLPAVLAAGVVGLAIRAALGVIPVVVPAAVVLVVLVLECGIATEAIGSLFERTDIGALQP